MGPGPVARSDPGTTPPGPATRVITLVPVGAGTGARAQLHWEFGQGGRLVVSGLAQPPPGRTYQMWLGSIKLGNRASGGLLMVDSQGEGTLRFAPPRATWSPDIFGVTVERQGGAREPSDELVLVGELTRQTAPRRSRARSPRACAAPGIGRARAGRRCRPPSRRRRPRPPSARPGPVHARPPGARRQRAAAGRHGLPAAVRRRRPGPGARSSGSSPCPWSGPGPSPSRSCAAWDGTSSAPIGPRASFERSPGTWTSRTSASTPPARVTRWTSWSAPSRSSQTSISVKRQLFEEQRILWSRERTKLPAQDTAVEQTVLDAIEPLL